MRRILLFSLVTAMLSCATLQTAQADWQEKWHAFWHRVNVDWHRNNAWPKPFSGTDREAYFAPLRVQNDNGWRLQNTLVHQLFDAETQSLNQAGEMKVHWIVTQAPMHRRTVYVLRGSNSEATAVRVDSVQQAIANMVPSGPLPEVLLTDVAPRGGSAAYYDRVNRGLESSTPAPVLPAMQSATGN